MISPAPGDQEVAFQINVDHYLHIVCYVILYYDYVLTLSMEIQRFWILHSFSWAGFFFFLNRYLSVLGHIPIIMLTFWNTTNIVHKSKVSPTLLNGYTSGGSFACRCWYSLHLIRISGVHMSDEYFSCHHLHSYHQYLEMATQLVVGVLLIMRVYALYDRNRWIVVFFVTFATVDIGIACWAIISKDPIKLAPQDFAVSAPGCAEPLSDEQGVHLAIAWSGQLAFDAIVFFLTLHKSLLIVRTSRRPLISTLLRDGVLYFAILTIANLANILTFLFAVPLSKGSTSTFVSIISATMISRLMLNLRDPKILTSSTNRTTTENSTTRLYPMMSTVIDPNPSIIPYTEEDHIYTQQELTYPIEDIELMPPKQKLGSKA